MSGHGREVGTAGGGDGNSSEPTRRSRQPGSGAVHWDWRAAASSGADSQQQPRPQSRPLAAPRPAVQPARTPARLAGLVTRAERLGSPRSTCGHVWLLGGRASSPVLWWPGGTANCRAHRPPVLDTGVRSINHMAFASQHSWPRRRIAATSEEGQPARGSCLRPLSGARISAHRASKREDSEVGWEAGPPGPATSTRLGKRGTRAWRARPEMPPTFRRLLSNTPAPPWLNAASPLCRPKPIGPITPARALIELHGGETTGHEQLPHGSWARLHVRAEPLIFHVSKIVFTCAVIANYIESMYRATMLNFMQS